MFASGVFYGNGGKLRARLKRVMYNRPMGSKQTVEKRIMSDIDKNRLWVESNLNVWFYIFFFNISIRVRLCVRRWRQSLILVHVLVSAHRWRCRGVVERRCRSRRIVQIAGIDCPIDTNVRCKDAAASRAPFPNVSLGFFRRTNRVKYDKCAQTRTTSVIHRRRNQCSCKAIASKYIYMHGRP